MLYCTLATDSSKNSPPFSQKQLTYRQIVHNFHKVTDSHNLRSGRRSIFAHPVSTDITLHRPIKQTISFSRCIIGTIPFSANLRLFACKNLVKIAIYVRFFVTGKVYLFYADSSQFFSRDQRKNVSWATPSSRAAWREVMVPDSQAVFSSGKRGGIGLRGRPNRTPRSLAAAMPSRWRWRMFSRSVCAT